MDQQNRPLLLDLIEWVSAQPRDYAELMEAWRTSCPRLTIWEDAVDLGLVSRNHRRGSQPVVTITAAGLALLAKEGRNSQSDPISAAVHD